MLRWGPVSPASWSNLQGIIAWSDPDSALEEKKEFVWAPSRIEDEIKVALTGSNIMDTDLYNMRT